MKYKCFGGNNYRLIAGIENLFFKVIPVVSERLKGPPLTVSHQPLGRHKGETTALLVKRH